MGDVPRIARARRLAVGHPCADVPMTIVVTGAAGSVGRRVCELLACSHSGEVLGLDLRPPESVPPGLEFKSLDLLTADLGPVFAGTDTLVHLVSALSADGAANTDGRIDLAIARRVLDAATVAGVGHVVLVSTAMVYGAWPDNPVPITEDAPVRPVPELDFAMQKTQLERLGLDWRTDHPDGVLTVLRPAVTVAEDHPGGLARILHSATTIVSEEGDPPAQFLQADDLATAIETVLTQRVDGVLNVAPDGWIPAEELAALAGPKPRLRVPGWLARRLAAVRYRLGLAPTPPGIVPYTTYPWVVSNDRLRGLGWRAGNTNEEAYVAAHAAGPLDMLTARRRQTLALGAMAAVAVGLAGAVAFGVVRLRRTR
ncbi:MAG: NAD-dependent epimerase/dehydratase family protein [Acidimicrobiia bacterium]|nr:NAD-dependent epimerase/dehydratase family protein [Acidimicrobiia bacterium]